MKQAEAKAAEEESATRSNSSSEAEEKAVQEARTGRN